MGAERKQALIFLLYPISLFASPSPRTLISGRQPSASSVCSPSTEELMEVCTKPRGGRLQERTGFLSPSPAPLELDVPGFCSTLEQPALLTALTQHPASHTPCFCSGTFQNSPVSISFAFSIPALRAASPPNPVSQRCLDLFCLNNVTWTRPGPISALLLR